MTGYQEILTDPSYKGQIVTMTYPLIGNYGINRQDVESRQPHVAGFVIKELPPLYSNYRADMSLDEYLKQNNIIGIEGIDTRALTRKLRISGAMRGVLSTEILDDAQLVDRAAQAPRDGRRRLGAGGQARTSLRLGPRTRATGGSARSSAATACTWSPSTAAPSTTSSATSPSAACKVTVLPPDTTAEEILKHKPDGLFVSNGPGDPAALDYAVKPLQDALGKVPIFGICLGHQLLGRAIGAKTYKLKFGHRGGNQPVKNLDTGRVEITSQNHGFAVDRKSLENQRRRRHAPQPERRHRRRLSATQRFPVFSVQYHPEASPGPHDAAYLLDAFVEMMKTKKPPTGRAVERAPVAKGLNRRPNSVHPG